MRIFRTCIIGIGTEAEDFARHSFKFQKHKTPGFSRKQGFCLHRMWR